MHKIIKKTYDIMSATQKIKAIYMPWYHDQPNNEQFHHQVVPELVESQHGPLTNGKLLTRTKGLSDLN